MQIHVARRAAQLGVFTPEEVVAGLRSGRFLPSDLAWRDGMASWTPLADWAEFQGSGVPATPAAMPSAATTVPWEQGKSLGSFFATAKAALTDVPRLSVGRYGFGEWLAFCYVAVAWSLPFQVAHLLMAGDQNAEMAELLRRLGGDKFGQVADQVASAPPTPAALGIFGAVLGVAFAPLIYAGTGLLHWVGQRVFGIRVTVERTVAASLLACGLVVILLAPLQLLAFDLLTQLVVTALACIPVCVVSYRALGAATGVNPWVQFGVSCFVWFVLCACCCVFPVALFALLSAHH